MTAEVSRVRLFLICAGSFLLYFSSWGMAQSFGVMYIALLDEFGGSKSETTWVQSLFSGILLLAGPLAGLLLKLYGCRRVAVVGTLTLSAGLVASVFTPSLYVLYVTYGVIGGFGGSFLFTAAGVVVLEHFDKRQSLAIGISGSGASAGTILIPLMTNYCLEQYGFRGTFLLLGGVTLNCLVAAAIFVPPPRKHDEQSSGSAHDTGSTELALNNSSVEGTHQKGNVGCRQRLAFVNAPYICFAISWAIMMLPFLVPFLFLPDAALSRGLSKQEATFIASAMGVGSVVGRAGFGFLGDIQRIETTLMHIVPITIFGTLNLAFTFVSDFVSSLLIAIFIGMISAVFDGIHPVITLQLVGEEHLSVGLGVLYCAMSFTTVLGNPVAGWIVDMSGEYNNCFYYSAGLSYLAAGFALAIPFLKRRRRRQQKNRDITEHAYDQDIGD